MKQQIYIVKENTNADFEVYLENVTDHYIAKTELKNVINQKLKVWRKSKLVHNIKKACIELLKDLKTELCEH